MMLVTLFNKRLSLSIGLSLACLGFIPLTFAASIAPEQDMPFDTGDTPAIVTSGSKIVVRKRIKPTQRQGVVVGSFLFVPSLALTEYHDDNVYATETNKKSDSVTVITPNFDLRSRWRKHKLDVNAGMEISRYADLTSENTQDYWFGMSGRYDFSARQNVFGGFNFSREHEDRASPDAAAGDTPTKYDDYTAHIGHAFASGNSHTRIAYTVHRLNFENVTSPSGVIDNSDRDRTEQAIGLRYLHKYSGTMALFVDGVVDKREYNVTPDFSGNDRNSDGYRYSLGFEYIGGASVLKMFAGTLARNYQSSLFENQSAFDFGLNYSWRFTGLSHLSIRSSRHIEETTFDNSSGYLLTNVSARLRLGISPTKAFHVIAATSNADYYGITRNDDYYDYSLGYSENVLKNLQVSFDLRRSERDSNIAGSDFKINQIILRVIGTI